MTRWPKMVIFGLTILAAVFLGWLASARMVTSIDYRNSDFFQFYLAGWMNWQGQDPYSTEQWIAGYKHFNATWMPNPIFPYPLPLATLMAPLGLFDLYNAFVAWVFLSGVLIICSCAGLLAGHKISYRFAYLLPLLAGALLFRPSLVTFHDGQLGAIMLFLIACSLLLWRNCQWFAGGALLGLLVLKPSLGIPLIAMTGLWLVFEGRFTSLAGIAASGVLLALIGFIQNRNWIADFFQTSNQMLSIFLGTSPSLWGISGAICQYQERCTWLLGSFWSAGLFLAVVCYLWNRRNKIDPLSALGIISATTIVITPYIWAYDHILTLITVIATVAITIRNGFPYLITASYPILLAALSAILVLVALRIGRDHWSAVVPLLSLFILIIILEYQMQRPVKANHVNY